MESTKQSARGSALEAPVKPAKTRPEKKHSVLRMPEAGLLPRTKPGAKASTRSVAAVSRLVQPGEGGLLGAEQLHTEGSGRGQGKEQEKETEADRQLREALDDQWRLDEEEAGDALTANAELRALKEHLLSEVEELI